MDNRRNRLTDETEAWLVKNDPEYRKQCRKWQTVSTDALARSRAVHDSMKCVSELQPKGFSFTGEPRGAGTYITRTTFDEDASGQTDSFEFADEGNEDEE